MIKYVVWEDNKEVGWYMLPDRYDTFEEASEHALSLEYAYADEIEV